MRTCFLIHSQPSGCFSHDGRGKEALLGLFFKALLMRTWGPPPSWHHHDLPKVSPSNTTDTLGMRFQHTDLVEKPTFSLYHTLSWSSPLIKHENFVSFFCFLGAKIVDSYRESHEGLGSTIFGTSIQFQFTKCLHCAVTATSPPQTDALFLQVILKGRCYWICFTDEKAEDQVQGYTQDT